jgi:hypothetical protein
LRRGRIDNNLDRLWVASQTTFPTGANVDEEVFNLDVRKFLKRFGVTAQREIEKAVDAALERGSLTGTEVLPVHARLSIPGVLSELQIDGEISLS